MARTYADAVRLALARRTVKSAQTDELAEIDRIFGLGDYGPMGKETLKEQAYDAITHLQSPEDRALWRKLDLPGQLRRIKENRDWLDAAKAKARKLTADDRISLEYARKGLAMNALKNSPREKVTSLKPKMPAPPAVSHMPIPPTATSTGVQPPPPIVTPSAGALPQTAKKPDAVPPYHPNVGGLLAATMEDPDAGRPVDTAAVARGNLMYTLRNKILTRRNLGIAGGLALAGGLSALAYRYISDYLARKREEEERRRMAQTKRAFAPPPDAAPGIPRDVRYFGRLPESVLRSIRSSSRRGGRAGAGIAAPEILDKLRNGGMGLDLDLFVGGDREKGKDKAAS